MSVHWGGRGPGHISRRPKAPRYFNGGDSRLRFAPPGFGGTATVVALPTGFQATTGTGVEEYRLTPNAGTRTSALQVNTAKRVEMIGGRTNYNPGSGSLAQQFGSISTSIFLEGQYITVTRSGDAIQAGGSSSGNSLKPDVYIQNTLMDGINGSSGGVHADGFQIAYSVRNLCFDKVTVVSNYQGIFIPPQFTISGDVYISRTNLKYTDDVTNPTTYALWLFDDQAQYDASTHHVYLNDVWVTPRSGKTLADCVWVAGSTNGTTGTDSIGDYIEFPNHPRVVGRVYKGPRGAGDFVTSAVAGAAYVSPGYQNPAF